MEPNWDDYRVFLAVARTGSLLGASQQLKMDPATASRRIARLEAALNAPLFLKLPRGYQVTETGQDMLTHIEEIESAERLARGTAAEGDAQLAGSVRIGAPDGMANYVLPQVCTRITLANPKIQFQIIALPRVFNLSKREADLAISISPPKNGRLLVRKICDYNLHLAAHESYLRDKPAIAGRADLNGHRVVGYVPDLIFDRKLDYLSEIGPDISPELSSNSVAVQMQLARHGGGLCIVHDFALPATPGMKRILPDEICLTRSFHMIRHRDDRRSVRMNQITELLVSGIKAEVESLESLVVDD